MFVHRSKAKVANTADRDKHNMLYFAIRSTQHMLPDEEALFVSSNGSGGNAKDNNSARPFFDLAMFQIHSQPLPGFQESGEFAHSSKISVAHPDKFNFPVVDTFGDHCKLRAADLEPQCGKPLRCAAT
jgi:hypothetical protein